MTFDEVMLALRSERTYQCRRWGVRQADGSMKEAEHSVEEWLVYIQDYLTEAIHHASREPGVEGAIETLRKVATMCVACFEQHGVKLRDREVVINGRDHMSA
jgi:hypothetical protein